MEYEVWSWCAQIHPPKSRLVGVSLCADVLSLPPHRLGKIENGGHSGKIVPPKYKSNIKNKRDVLPAFDALCSMPVSKAAHGLGTCVSPKDWSSDSRPHTQVGGPKQLLKTRTLLCFSTYVRVSNPRHDHTKTAGLQFPAPLEPPQAKKTRRHCGTIAVNLHKNQRKDQRLQSIISTKKTSQQGGHDDRTKLKLLEDIHISHPERVKVHDSVSPLSTKAPRDSFSRGQVVPAAAVEGRWVPNLAASPSPPPPRPVAARSRCKIKL